MQTAPIKASAIMMRMETIMVRIASHEITNAPSKSEIGFLLMMEVKLLGDEPKINSAAFCKK